MDIYSGKPTAYLDQNALDIMVKNPNLPFEDLLKNGYQVVYSDETLKEIQRSNSGKDGFLSVLERLNAMYLKVIVDNEFNVTGDATLSACSPNDSYLDYIDNLHPIYMAMQEATSLSLQKFYGGQGNLNFDDIAEQQRTSFDNLLSHTKSLRTKSIR